MIETVLLKEYLIMIYSVLLLTKPDNGHRSSKVSCKADSRRRGTTRHMLNKRKAEEASKSWHRIEVDAKSGTIKSSPLHCPFPQYNNGVWHREKEDDNLLSSRLGNRRC